MRSTPLTYFRPRHCGQLFLIFLLLSGWLASSVYAFSPSPPDSLSANEDTLRLLFVGDVMGHGPQIRSAEILKNKVYNYDPCFQYVKPIIQQADLAIANLEVTLPGKPPYQGYPRFRSPNDLAHALRSAGFDLLVTANNHSNDAGKAGVISTIKTVQELGFYQTGTFKNQLDRDVFYPLLVYKNGFKLAFLNYTYDTNKIPTRPPTVVNEIDEALIKADLAEAQQLKPDAIIVVMHWGNEYQMQESKKQQALGKKIFEWGADLIIGAHPHVVQPVKTMSITTPDGQTDERLIAYSLGNFISNQKQPNTDGGLMLEIDLIKKDSSNEVRVARSAFIPVWRYIHRDEEGKATYHTLPAAAFTEVEQNELKIPASSQAAMKKSLLKLRKHLTAHGIQERKITFKDLQLPAAIPEE